MNAMTFDAEQRAFLAASMRSFLFANRRDGTPTGWPMTLLSCGDDHVYVNTYRSSVKARVLLRDRRVGLLALYGDRALAITGDAQLVDPAESLQPRLRRCVLALLDIADHYYRSGERGLSYLPLGSRIGILVAARVYHAIGTRLRQRDMAYWLERAVVPTHQKVTVTVSALVISVRPL